MKREERGGENKGMRKKGKKGLYEKGGKQKEK